MLKNAVNVIYLPFDLHSIDQQFGEFREIYILA